MESRQPATVAGAEEEALKRSADCVYFLASPLTCKKGNDCEYRHSDGARMNPRDCWFWLNGNCLNPKCTFRHPPLEGMLGTTATAGSSLDASQNSAAMQMLAVQPIIYNPNKQSVPCYYFQKGLCLKGDWCPFMHGSQPTVKPASQQTSKANSYVDESSQTPVETTAVLEKYTSQQKIPRVNMTKPTEVMAAEKFSADVEIMPSMPSNGITSKKMKPSSFYEELPQIKPGNAPLLGGNFTGGIHGHQMEPPEDRLHNGREGGEFLGESSPGFDVLVDNDLEDSEYFRLQAEYGRGAGDGGRHQNSMNEYDYKHSSEHETLTKYHRESYLDFQDYDQYGRLHNEVGWEHQRRSIERNLVRPSMIERRPREQSPDQIDYTDLRHHLLKQRKVSGSRSTTSPNRRLEINERDNRYIEEQRYRGRPRRDRCYISPESSISDCLQYRIILPGRSSPDTGYKLLGEKELDRGRNWSRLSPSRPASYRGKHNDRNRWTQENFTTEARNFRGQRRRDGNIANSKYLTEPRVRASDRCEDQLTKNRTMILKSQLGETKSTRSGKIVGHPEPDSLTFEGPKPLSKILEKKRASALLNGSISADREGSRQVKKMDPVVAREPPNNQVLDSGIQVHDHSGSVRTAEENYINDEEGLVATEDPKSYDDDQTSPVQGDALEMGAGAMDDVAGDQEHEAYDDDGESDYETVDVGDFKTEDENAEQDEYFDDDDGDDFSRRIGAMLS